MMASVWHRVICRQVSHVSYVEVQFVTRLTRPATHTSRSKKCLYVSLLQDGGSVDSANWQGLHSKPLWKAVPCERRPGDQVISACMPPLRRHSCVYKSEGPNPSPAHDAERPAVRNNAMEGVRRKHARTRDMMPAAACATVNHHQNTPQNQTKTQRHTTHENCLTLLSEALKEEVITLPRQRPDCIWRRWVQSLDTSH